MVVQTENMCSVITSLLRMSLNTSLTKEHGLFCTELCVSVIEIVSSFS
jgi:hypothetical protein